MSDKSPKSKQRSKNQKKIAAATAAAAAQSKRDGQGHTSKAARKPGKG